MTLAMIGNIGLAAFVLSAIPGLLLWAVHTSHHDTVRATAAARRRATLQRRSSARQAPAARRPALRTGPARATAS